MNKVYLDLATGFEQLAACYRALAAQDQSVHNEPEVVAPATEKALTIEDVRAVMSRKSDEGKTAQIKALLLKYDAGKLSGVNPKDYASLLREVEAL